MLKNGAGKCFFPHAENAGKKDKKECRLSGEFNPPRNKRAKKVSAIDLVEKIRASLETPEEKNKKESAEKKDGTPPPKEGKDTVLLKKESSRKLSEKELSALAIFITMVGADTR